MRSDVLFSNRAFWFFSLKIYLQIINLLGAHPERMIQGQKVNPDGKMNRIKKGT